ncbi:PQQ-binding-like beta-propeller repeat protein [bacterium]|nr:PQQ-binding-like beta-propeller repeat protein [bacterium]
MAYSPDGRLLATSSDDGTAKLWDVATGDLVHTFVTEPDLFTLPSQSGNICFTAADLAFRPDGKALLTGDGCEVVAWDIQSGRRIGEVGLDGDIARFSPDASLAASANPVAVCNVATGRQLWKVDSEDEYDTPRVAFSRDGDLLVVRRAESVVLHDARTGAVQQAFRTPRVMSFPSPVALSADGSKLATTTASGNSFDERRLLWDVGTGELLWSAPSGSPLLFGVHQLAFTPDGSALIGVQQCCVGVWDVATGALRAISEMLPGPYGAGHVYRMAFSPDGDTIATVCGEGVVHLFDWRANAWRETIGRRPTPVRAIAMSPDGLTLASGSDDGAVRVWDTANARLTTTLHAHTSMIHDLAFSPDGQLLAATAWEGAAMVWNARSHEPRHSIDLPHQGCRPLAFSPDAATLALSDWTNPYGRGPSTLILVDMQSGRRQRVIEGGDGAIDGIAFSPDGALLVTTKNGSTFIHDARTGRLLTRTDDDRDWESDPTFSPCGRLLALANWGSIIFLDPHSPALEKRFVSLVGDGASDMAFSPDGRTLLVGHAYTDTFLLIDVATGAKRLELRGHVAPIQSVAWSPDGQRAYTGSADGTINVWNTQPLHLLTTLT